MELTRDEKYLARILFKNKVYSTDKQGYEDFFAQIMDYAFPSFQVVKPQGQYGDRKNDGFDDTTGSYYQVYAPEDLRFNEETAITKLQTDFSGLKAYWGRSGFSINQYFYVVNDKYAGNYPTLHKAIKALNQENEGIDILLFRAKDLEDVFIGLSADKILAIIGGIPDPYNIRYEYSVMNEVVDFLLNKEGTETTEKIPSIPDFDRKIRFNGLSESVRIYLRMGNILSHAITDYFELNSTFSKEQLRKIFVDLYKEESSRIPDSDTKNDEVFFAIAKKASPNDKHATLQAVYILMAYYFEYCDIYETPPEDNNEQLSIF